MSATRQSARTRPFIGYAIAVVAVVVAFLWRLAMERYVGVGLPTYITFYPAVAVVAVVAGIWPGILATVLSVLVVDYFLLPPVGQFGIERPVDAIGLALFFLMGVFISALAEGYRRNRQKALSSSEAKMQGIVNSAMDAIISVDEQQRIVVFNPAAEAIFQCAASAAMGSSLARFLPPELREAHGEHIRRFGVAGVTTRSMRSPSILRALRTNGETFPIEATISQVQTSGERLYTVILRDITERKKAEEALRESEELLRTQMEHMPIGCIVFDERCCFSQLNPAAERIFGYTAAELRGQNMTLIVPVAVRAHVDGIVQRVAEGETTANSVHENVTKDGHSVICEWTNTPLWNDKGALIGILSMVQNVTERKRAEEALLRSEKLATVGRMAATMAHEINNPLAAVTNALYLARTNLDSSEMAQQYLDMADQELERVAHITRSSLGFYRESNAPTLTSVDAVLESAADLLRKRVEAKHAMVKKQWDSGIQVMAVAGELRQVFSNLLANSLDAIEDRGTIALRVSRCIAFKSGRRCLRVTVADNGKGVDANLRQRIFEPFYTTKGMTGTGLGLWVSKQIIEKHRGSIRMRSSTDSAHRGTTFSIVIPVDAEQAGQAARKATTT